MLPSERQGCIREWIEKENSMKISELSERLGVSEMTVHRDLRSLIDEGLVEKTFGGITKKTVTESSAPDHTCFYCSRHVRERLAYRLILPDHVIRQACCAHCGLLLHQQFKDAAIQAICHDFLTETTISALQASFVLDADLDIGCCQPQVLSFGRKEDAERFVKGFGGSVYTFQGAMGTVQARMNPSAECCKRPD